MREPISSETHPLFATSRNLSPAVPQYLFDNSRKENIFFDPIYKKFSETLVRILRGFSPSGESRSLRFTWRRRSAPRWLTVASFSSSSAGVQSCVEEPFLWECKQLGAYSPLILLNTLLYFCSKHFGLTTVEQHRQLSFAHVMCCTKTNLDHTKTTYMRFYPPLRAKSAESGGSLAVHPVCVILFFSFFFLHL